MQGMRNNGKRMRRRESEVYWLYFTFTPPTLIEKKEGIYGSINGVEVGSEWRKKGKTMQEK